MTYRNIRNRLLILTFMALVGFSFAKAFSSGSFLGIVLAMISLLAGIYIIHLLARAKREMETEETN